MKQWMKKKGWVILIIGGSLLFIAFLYLFMQEKPVVFLIDGKEVTTKTITHEFGNALDLSPKALNLVAKKGNETCKIVYSKQNFTQLKTYRVVYRVKDEEETFVLHIKVQDTTAPSISGELQYQITQGDVFDSSHLSLHAMDQFDQDLSDQFKMESVDTNTPGEYDILVSVADQSGNEAKVTIHLTIQEKPKAKPLPSSNPNEKIIVSNPNDIMVMINKQYALPNGWSPADLVPINSNGGGNHVLRSEAAMKWEEMRQAALQAGISVRVVSSYRTQAYQAGLYHRYMANDPINAPYYSAYPRTSEHELGLAIDVSYDWSLHDNLLDSAVGKWMADNSYRYGYILRYPQGKTNITGYTFEAWHYRYVGVTLASALYQSGQTMEEYYN